MFKKEVHSSQICRCAFTLSHSCALLRKFTLLYLFNPTAWDSDAADGLRDTPLVALDRKDSLVPATVPSYIHFGALGTIPPELISAFSIFPQTGNVYGIARYINKQSWRKE